MRGQRATRPLLTKTPGRNARFGSSSVDDGRDCLDLDQLIVVTENGHTHQSAWGVVITERVADYLPRSNEVGLIARRHQDAGVDHVGDGRARVRELFSGCRRPWLPVLCSRRWRQWSRPRSTGRIRPGRSVEPRREPLLHRRIQRPMRVMWNGSELPTSTYFPQGIVKFCSESFTARQGLPIHCRTHPSTLRLRITVNEPRRRARSICRRMADNQTGCRTVPCRQDHGVQVGEGGQGRHSENAWRTSEIPTFGDREVVA